MKIMLISLVLVSSFSLIIPSYAFFPESPYWQAEFGHFISIECKKGLELIIKANTNTPACVKPNTPQKLAERGWATLGILDAGHILPLGSFIRLTDEKFEQQTELINIVQNYNGLDGEGPTIKELLKQRLEEKYSNENFFENPTFIGGWHAAPMDTRDNCCYSVLFSFKTPQEKTHYEWGILLDTKEIRGVARHAESLDILNKVEEG